MAELQWFECYSGQTTEELLSLQAKYRIDSLVLAFEQAIDQKATRDGDAALSQQERVVLAIEALEREVNNGGYEQFFLNSSREFAPMIVQALISIGCPKTSKLTKRALDALGLVNITGEAIEKAMSENSEERSEELSRCDSSYFAAEEAIAARLFAYIRMNQEAIKL